MAHGNVRVRERFEVSLGGFQIASIVVGAVMALAVVFFLGLEVGQRVGTRRAEAARPASLGDLDAAATTATPASGKDLTFPAALPKAKPSAPPPPRTTPPAATADEAVPPTPPPSDVPPPTAAPPAAGAASRGGWTVQLGASQRREEAEALAKKVQGLGPRIEEADIPGKGHFFRVRVGRFESRAEAEKYKSDVIRETGITGGVIPPTN